MLYLLKQKGHMINLVGHMICLEGHMIRQEICLEGHMTCFEDHMILQDLLKLLGEGRVPELCRYRVCVQCTYMEKHV